MNKRIVGVAIFVVMLDQLTKIGMKYFLKLNESVRIIKDFFCLTLCRNDGVAFGLLSNKRIVILIASIVSILIMYRFMFLFEKNKRNHVAFGLILGGLSGNLLDRTLLGYVRDFIDFVLFGYDFPVFNVADVCIFIGVVLLIYAIIRGEDSSEDSSRKR